MLYVICYMLYAICYILFSIQLPEATPPPGLRMHRKAIARPSKNRPSWDTNPFKNRRKWKPKWFKIAPKRPLGGVWGGLGAILAPRWPQEAKNLRKSISGAPSWEAFWDQKFAFLSYLIIPAPHLSLLESHSIPNSTNDPKSHPKCSQK